MVKYSVAKNYDLCFGFPILLQLILTDNYVVVSLICC